MHSLVLQAQALIPGVLDHIVEKKIAMESYDNVIHIYIIKKGQEA